MKATDCIHRQRCAALICCCYYLQAACASNQIYIYFQRELTENTSRSKIWLGIMLVYANFLRSIIMRVSYLVLFNACNDKFPAEIQLLTSLPGLFWIKRIFNQLWILQCLWGIKIFLLTLSINNNIFLDALRQLVKWKSIGKNDLLGLNTRTTHTHVSTLFIHNFIFLKIRYLSLICFNSLKFKIIKITNRRKYRNHFRIGFKW